MRSYYMVHLLVSQCFIVDVVVVVVVLLVVVVVVFLQWFIWFLIIHSTDAIYTVICFPDVVGITRQQVFLFWHPLLKLHFQSLLIQQSHHC